ncbi:MAG TPA: amino acid ABC transporter substrate-binding protein [Stellaceae bacterium]|nr:amino acid ABC transporter substrate-binding protein [Stellaceae bacterium]
MIKAAGRRGGARPFWKIPVLAALVALAGVMPAGAAEPIRIGFGMALTGGLAANGKSALVAMKIWEADTNAKGGLLGRPVQLVYYDDQSNPSTVPGIYTKLLDVDKVDLVVGGYATNMLAPAMPVIIQHNVTFLGLFGLAVNSEFHYPNYFAMVPSGPKPKIEFSKGFFDVAMAQTPKPQTIAIVAADAEFARNAADGARENAKAAGLKIVYDRTYPPSTVDFSSIVKSVQAVDPDILYVGSYPPDTAGMVRAMNEIGLHAKICCGGMVGLQSAALKTQLGPMLNGIIDYDFWLPAPTMQFPGVMELLEKYQAQAASEGVDLLGYYMPPYAYADLQVLGEAIQETKSLDQAKLAAYMREHTFKTVVGDVKFGEGGEWASGRVLQVQFQHVKGNDVEQFKNPATQVIVAPAKYESGKVIYPWASAKQ